MVFLLDKVVMVMATTVATVVLTNLLTGLALQVRRLQVCLLLGYYLVKFLMLLRFIDFLNA